MSPVTGRWIMTEFPPLKHRETGGTTAADTVCSVPVTSSGCGVLPVTVRHLGVPGPQAGNPGASASASASVAAWGTPRGWAVALASAEGRGCEQAE